MNELDHLDTVHAILEDRQEATDAWDDMTLAGGLVVGLYASLDGQRCGVRYHALGGMNVHTLEGVLRKMIRDIESGNHAAYPDAD